MLACGYPAELLTMLVEQVRHRNHRAHHRRQPRARRESASKINNLGRVALKQH